MTRKQTRNLAALCAVAFSLSGCVAAAIPVVAGGAILRSSTDGKDAGRDKPEAEIPEVTPPKTSPALAKTEKVATVRVAEATPSTTATKPAAPVDSQVESQGEVPAEKPKAEPTSSAIAPVPASNIPPTPAGKLAPLEPVTPTPAPAPKGFETFLAYAKKQGAMTKAKALSDTDLADRAMPLSALLRDPVALDGKRKACVAAKPAVVVDLDSGNTTYEPGMALKSDPTLMLGLGELRAAGFLVAWQSSASAAYAGDLRMALRTSGLDALGRDALLLMRYPDDRKQKRREELAMETCLVAIAGDERADFDERFKYLRNPEDARSLDAIIDQGWFLVPDIVTDGTGPQTFIP
jgi:hypothetical protein